MTPEDFKFYQKMLLDASGLSITADKTYLLTTRLDPIARNMGLANLSELTARLRAKPDPRTAALVVQAMATKETSFFRDITPFNHLKNTIFPALMARNPTVKTIRIWSAACSTGQEPYSIAMVAREFFRAHPGWSAQILATDMAEDALAAAREGVYSQFDIQRGLSMKLMLEHFTIENTKWKVHDDLKAMVRFMRFNLLQPMDAMGKFDIIFCRNVLIYFDAGNKRAVLDRLGDRLKPDGYLFLGACESVIGLGTKFRPSPELAGVQVPALPVPAPQREGVTS